LYSVSDMWLELTILRTDKINDDSLPLCLWWIAFGMLRVVKSKLDIIKTYLLYAELVAIPTS